MQQVMHTKEEPAPLDDFHPATFPPLLKGNNKDLLPPDDRSASVVLHLVHG